MFFEPLEPRLTLTTGITASLQGDQVVVQGTAADDTIVLDEVSGFVRVLDQGTAAYSFASASVASAYVMGNVGNDTITIDASFGAWATTA